MSLADFDFELPPELIAQEPLRDRPASRLLHVQRGATFANRHFHELGELLRPGDLLVVNDSRVMQARLFGHKASGGKVEILIERPLDTHEALAMVRASKSPPTGSSIQIDRLDAHAGRVQVLGRDGMFFRLRFAGSVDEVMAQAGQLPLPPYMTRQPNAADSERYQTVYSQAPGSVAAPTAGLHFDEALLASLERSGIKRCAVTLHVGAGTFSPVRDDDLDKHQMHAERYWIPPATVAAIAATRRAGGRVIAVGTTSLRTLESAARVSGDGLRAGPGETSLFIRPGDPFLAVDALITNFHLPRSTLIMLVAAFAGLDTIRAAYAHAIAHRYRFFSYGDAMFLDLAPPREASTSRPTFDQTKPTDA